jgi:septal ring factor EnvC (AmiA/AmiB activator)
MKDFDAYFQAVVAGLVTGVLSGIGSAMAWFKSKERKLEEQMEQLQRDIKRVSDQRGDHAVRLGQIETRDQSTAETLEDLKDGHKTIHEKLDTLSRDIMTAIRNQDRR